ncbi:sensor histidine kinase, partial [Pseudomonas syringae group genomosp. 7]|uniref:sensor histidine kinase n=1 Tax=Pseudomonas syringae group genomosp. 7 TaxID=251699 RepID=UPI00376FE5BD
MFEEFHRGDRSNGQGLGLGLAIAHRIAGLLHAPLHLRSVLDHGSTFSISVQRAARPATPRNSPPTGGSSALKG